MDREQPLPGGNVGGAARLGDRVLRPAGPWTPTIQRLLRHLAEAGFSWVPEPLGVHRDGREVVGFIDGEVPSYPLPEWLWGEHLLFESATLLRHLHDCTADYQDTEARWRQPVRRPAEVVCHNDFAPYNMVFDAGRLVGVIDFDMASPGPRVWDLAYLAYRLVPLTGPDNPDGIPNGPDRYARLARLLEAYGVPLPLDHVLEVVVDRLHDLADDSDRRAVESNRDVLHRHAALYRRDADYVHSLQADWAG